MKANLKGFVLFVRDIQKSCKFYQEILHQEIDLDHGLNIGFQSGLALWQIEHAHQIIFRSETRNKNYPNIGSDNLELYFETDDIEEAEAVLRETGMPLIHAMQEEPWGQRTIRFYDPDGHIIELGESMEIVITKLYRDNLSIEEISKKTAMPPDVVKQMIRE